MAITREQRQEQNRLRYAGYKQGRDRRWPDWVPPLPESLVVARVIAAAINLRNAVDGELATLDDDDAWQTTLGNPMDELTEALSGITEWIAKESSK